MRCFFILLPALFVCVELSAQKKKIVEDSGDWDKTFTKIELEANTNERAWAAYLKKAAAISDSSNIPPGEYTVKVKFIVDTYGNIGDIKAASNPGYGLARRAEKIIANYDGVWKPASQCGRNVKSYKEQVITFTVKE